MELNVRHPDGRALKLEVVGDRIRDIEVLPESQTTKDLLWVLPSFADNHLHPVYVAECLPRLAALPPEVNSLAELVDKLKKRKPDNGWLIAWGYDEAKWPEHRHPTRWDLDEVSRDLPVVVMRNCTHMLVANSKALELCGIDETTKPPAGGVIERDANGLTGLLKEEARFLVMDRFPQKDFDEQIADLRTTYQAFYRCGITAIAEMLGGPKEWALYEALRDEPMQVAFYADYHKYTEKELLRLNRDPAKRLYLRGIKMICDGSVGGRTAYRTERYLDKDTHGVLVMDPDEIRSVLELGARCNLEVAAHGMGDKTLEIILKEYAKLDVRPHLRLEHATMLHPELIRQAKELGVAVSSQPVFLFSEVEAYESAFTPEVLATLYPHRLYADSGLTWALSSDAPATAWATAYNPWVGIYGATTRRSYNGHLHGADMAVTRAEAIEAYSQTAFQMLGLEAPELKVDCPARFMLYADNPLTVSDEDLLSLRPVQVYVGEQALLNDTKD